MRAMDHKAVRAMVLAKTAPDISVENHGSIFLLRPLNVAATNWLDTVTNHDIDDADAAQWFGGALVVEPRYVADIVNGAREAGLEVR